MQQTSLIQPFLCPFPVVQVIYFRLQNSEEDGYARHGVVDTSGIYVDIPVCVGGTPSPPGVTWEGRVGLIIHFQPSDLANEKFKKLAQFVVGKLLYLILEF